MSNKYAKPGKYKIKLSANGRDGDVFWSADRILPNVSLIEEYSRRFPELSERGTVTWCFDEIQVVPGWERFVRRHPDATSSSESQIPSPGGGGG